MDPLREAMMHPDFKRMSLAQQAQVMQRLGADDQMVSDWVSANAKGDMIKPLQAGAAPPQGFEDTSADAQRVLSEHADPQNRDMLNVGLTAAGAGATMAGLTSPAVLAKVLPMLPRALGGITGAMEGNKQGGPLGAVVGGATGVALPGATGAGAGALEGYEAGGIPGLLAGAALGSLGGSKGRAALQGGRRIIGRLGKLALEAPEAAADTGAAARAMEAAKAASEVKAAETLAPAVSGEGAFAQTTTQPARVIGSIGKLPLQGAPAAYTDAGDAALAKVRQLMSMPGGKEAVREFLKTQPPEVALDLTKKLGRYAFSQ